MNNELEKFTCSLSLPLVRRPLSFCVFLLQLFSFLPSSSFSASLPSSMTVKQTLTYPYLHSMVSAAAVLFASVRFDSILFCVVLFTAELGFYCGVVFGLFALPSPTPSCCTQSECRALQHGGYDDIKNPTNNGTINSYNISDNNKTNNVKSKAQSALNVVLVFQSRLCVCGHHSGQSYFS